MRNLARTAIATAALALLGGAGLAATAATASAQDVRVRVGVNSGYTHYRPYRYHSNRYYYQQPTYRYRYHYKRPYYRWRDHRRRDFLNCRWVPGEGRVCW